MRVADRKGFTLIELLIVVVIIGILAAIAIPKFSSTKEKAYIAAMKSDLHNLATAQEVYNSQQDPNTYASALADLTAEFNASTGVNITIVSGTTTGWSATATHDNVTGVTCAYFYGDAGAVAPADTQGEVKCS